MKKRVCSLLLALVMTFALMAVPAAARGGYPDVSDQTTARNAEVLRMLGIMVGDSSGSFRPYGTLTRAEFCKMAVAAMGRADEVLRYQTMTIFPDVRTKHWAVGYINYAVRGTAGAESPALISGMPDGTFHPDDAITYAQAVAILGRVLGYSDADAGGVWPTGYLNLAQYAGLSEGLNLSAGSTISRAQAAQLFVNLLLAKTKAGADGYTPEGYERAAATTTLLGISGTKMRTTANPTGVEMVRPATGSELVGLSGYVIKKGEKAAAFLPVSPEKSDTAAAASAIILSANNAASEIDALSGGKSGYTINKNGVKVTLGSLRSGDVAAYDASSNTVFVCDTRVSAYYEECVPNPSSPATVKILGTEFSVLPTAQASLARFKPGQVVTFLFSFDGQIAGAQENGGNALAIASGDKYYLICGAELIELNDFAPVNKSQGALGRISSAKDKDYFSAQTSTVSDHLDLSALKLGGRPVSSSAIVIKDGEITGLSLLTGSFVPAAQIAYVRTGADGEIDLLVLSDSLDGAVYYGRAIVTAPTKEDGSEDTKNRTLRIDCGAKESPELHMGYAVETGDFVEAVAKNGRYSSVTKLTALKNISSSAWVGDTAVLHGGKTYVVPANVPCFNRDSATWFGSLEEALAYSGTMNLYVKDGMIRVIEVYSK